MSDPDLLQAAEAIEQHLRILRRAIRRPLDADVTQYRVTAPQFQVLHRLSKQDGLRLSELSHQVALSNSTVSGIVDRLEARGWVRRDRDPDDRRATRVFLAERVKAYLGETMPAQRLAPLIAALRQASPEQRAAIVNSLALLQQLVAAGGDGGQHGGDGGTNG
jgi:DNA-binding MarR family transcriptional regulator